MVYARNAPLGRVRCVTELSSDHSIPLKENLTTRENELFKSFIHEMYAQLAKPYITAAKETVYIKADKSTVHNIARCNRDAMLERTAST